MPVKLLRHLLCYLYALRNLRLELGICTFQSRCVVSVNWFRSFPYLELFAKDLFHPMTFSSDTIVACVAKAKIRGNLFLV